METDLARLRALVGRFAGMRILVAGDLMLDEFIWGRASRISPEAPVPVIHVTGESYYPGGAANVARNLREFTDAVALVGAIGTDPPGCRLNELLQTAGIDTSGVVQTAAFSTTVKSRIIARSQQVVRVDRERRAPLDADQLALAAAHFDRAIAQSDAVIAADYGKGFLSQPLADAICGAARRHRKILTVDPHPHTALSWKGATAIKPNRAESFLAAGLPLSDAVSPVLSDQALLEAARRLLAIWETETLLITLGEDGMLLVGQASACQTPVHLPTRAKDVFDVSGAGDTAIAVLTLALSAGAAPADAAELANRASGIAVGKLGTATVTPAELLAAL